MHPVIRIEDLGKRYKLGLTHAGSIRELVDSAVSRLFGRGSPPRPQEPHAFHGNGSQLEGQNHFWALRDVSFQVEPGEVIGVIGKNGAGKSTLLKLLSRITTPTEGRVELFGRVASLLEVGTGFHPELTGRENVFLNGTMLGMTKAEVRKKFDEIVAFSEVEQFIDTPVKRYSSGMYVRLAFAVAAHLEPEILVVDEVLAVGDASFQKKCLGKMGSVARAGRTVLLVSHNMLAIRKLATRALHLESGRIHRLGETSEVVNQYLEKEDGGLTTERRWNSLEEAPGDGRVRLLHAVIRHDTPSANRIIESTTPLVLEFVVENLVPGALLLPNLQVLTCDEIVAFTSTPRDLTASAVGGYPRGAVKFTCRLPGNLLNSDEYRIRFRLYEEGRLVFDFPDVLSFRVQACTSLVGHWYNKQLGVVCPVLQWDAE